MPYEEANSAVNKRLTVFDDDDYHKLEDCQIIIDNLIMKSPERHVFILKETFNDNKCPLCQCPTLANIVDEYTNDFIQQCVACQLKLNISLA
jgi:hypothetical protein